MKNFSTSTGLFSKPYSLNLKGRLMELFPPKVMGIINATPDSFYPASRLPGPEEAIGRAGSMVEEGAHILDVGAASSRPGAQEISEQEEMDRLLPVLEAIRSHFPETPVSVDTWRSNIVREADRRVGIQMVNDISAGNLDPDMFRTVADLKLPYIMMHMQGTPETMQKSPVYEDVVDELLQFFADRVHTLRKLGLNDLVVDPGFGFGKTREQNFTLLDELEAFRMLELPLMVGVSRKAMIYRTLEVGPDQALNGTTAAHMAALLKGAHLLRVHDVRAAVETVRIFEQIVFSKLQHS